MMSLLIFNFLPDSPLPYPPVLAKYESRGLISTGLISKLEGLQHGLHAFTIITLLHEA
jgi:hypothetical protein